jgi:hypothetical protein
LAKPCPAVVVGWNAATVQSKELHEALQLEIVEHIDFSDLVLHHQQGGEGLFQFTIDFYGKFRKSTQNTRHNDASFTWSTQPGPVDRR